LQKSATTEEAGKQPERSWTDTDGYPTKISELRAKLYGKAKQEPEFRFYSLFGQILRRDVLWAAWGRVAENDGCPGVDGMTIEEVATAPGGPGVLLEEIERELRARTYRPTAVKRVMIPKANGTLRPLGIPSIKDRVVQTAVKIVIEPIFEADFLECSYGFRPGRSAHDALAKVVENIKDGRVAIYDADLASYFDTIPHDKLMACVEKRISDQSVLALIRLWLVAEVEEKDEDGGPPRRHRPKAGTPQGGVISPLLANLYLHWFDKLCHRGDGPRYWANARLVRYADDFTIQAKFISSRLRTWIETTLEGRFGLTINRTKTSVKQVSPATDETLDFLGYRIWHAPDRFTRGRRYRTANPSPKAMAAERENLRKIICTKNGLLPIEDLVGRVNRQMAGWSAYHQAGRPARCFSLMNRFISNRIYRHLRRRSQRPYRLPEGKTWWQHLTDDLGLVPLMADPAKASL
jgi:RNA-directed DNA polymerase